MDDDWWAEAGMAGFIPKFNSYRPVNAPSVFRADDPIPSVEVIPGPPESGYRYQLFHGAHRFYCSLAAGYTYVPAIKGFQLEMLDG